LPTSLLGTPPSRVFYDVVSQDQRWRLGPVYHAFGQDEVAVSVPRLDAFRMVVRYEDSSRATTTRGGDIGNLRSERGSFGRRHLPRTASRPGPLLAPRLYLASANGLPIQTAVTNTNYCHDQRRAVHAGAGNNSKGRAIRAGLKKVIRTCGSCRASGFCV